MGFVTPAITYNVHERGRSALGADRSFDLRTLAAVINGPATQEKVKSGDLVGYFGHWPRIKFGMAPREGGVVDGKAVSVHPAVRTVELSCTASGDITHRTEFLDNEEGTKALALYRSKVGGFSSAIDAVPGSMPSVATAMHGFDYVLQPNYNTNRGHRILLDSLAERDPEMMALLDSVVAEHAQAENALVALLDGMESAHGRALEAMARLEAENQELVARLASGRMLDSIGDPQLPQRLEVAIDYRSFLGGRLEPLAVLDSAQPPASAQDRDELLLTRTRYGLPRVG